MMILMTDDDILILSIQMMMLMRDDNILILSIQMMILMMMNLRNLHLWWLPMTSTNNMNLSHPKFMNFLPLLGKLHQL